MKCIKCLVIIISLCKGQFSDDRAVDNYLSQNEEMKGFIARTVNSFSENCHVENTTSISVQRQRLQVYQYYDGEYHSYPIREAAVQLLKSQMFNPTLTTVIFVTGFGCSPDDYVATGLAKAFEKRGGVNFLSFDFYAYGKGYFLQYFDMVRHTLPVAKHLSKFIMDLIMQGISKNKIRLIGYSYGAQLAGIAGNLFRKASGSHVTRLTGLDPIILCFPDTTDNRLSKNSAKYVDIIQTSFISAGRTSIGHATFIVNGDTAIQPGCKNDFLKCIHERSAFIYMESITDEQSVLARNCDSWSNFTNGKCQNNKISPLGFNSYSDCRGDYYIRTAIKPPYGIGVKGLN